MPAAIAPRPALPPGAAGPRFALALAASLAAHGLVLAMNLKLAPPGGGRLFPPTLSVILTDLKSAPRDGRAELAAAGEGGGNSDAPGHAESAAAADELRAQALLQEGSAAARFEKGETLSLPTERRTGTGGQRAPLRGPRQAGSQSAAGPAERGGDDCWVVGYRFCSPE